MPIYSPTGFLDVTNATLRTSNLEAENFKLNGGNIYVSTDFTVAPTLQLITNGGSVTSNTVEFTNPTTGLVTTGNVEVGGELTVTGNVAVDTDTLFVDTVNSRFGVGTSSPLETLDVYGGFLMRPERTTKSYFNAWSRPTSGTFTAGSPITGPTINVIYSKNAIYTTTGGLKVSPPNTDTEYYYETGFSFIYSPYGSYYIHFPTGSSTTSPYLSGDVFSSTRFKADNTEDFTGFAIGQDYEAGVTLNDYSQSLDIARAHSAHMYFKTASPDGSLTEKMRITNTGNVGIGTTSPSHALTVAAASGDAEVHIQAQGNDGGDAILYFNGSSTNQRKCAIISSNVAPNSYCKQDLHFCMETTNDLSDVDITDSKMVITNGGNVGIGVSNPTKMIHTKGEVVVGTDADNYTTQKGSLYFVRGVGRTNDGFGDRHHYISTRTEGNVGNGNNMTFHIDDGTTTNGTSHTSPLKLMGDGSVQLVGWKTKSWSGNTVNNGNRDVDVVTHSGLDSGVGIMAGIIEVIITRGGYAQQRAYARFHVNYSFWASAFRGNFDVLEKILTADVTDITLIISNNPAKIQVRITSPSTSTGQYYIKFDGPIYNPA
jgi:hypothetical protein